MEGELLPTDGVQMPPFNTSFKFSRKEQESWPPPPPSQAPAVRRGAGVLAEGQEPGAGGRDMTSSFSTTEPHLGGRQVVGEAGGVVWLRQVVGWGGH